MVSVLSHFWSLVWVNSFPLPPLLLINTGIVPSKLLSNSWLRWGLFLLVKVNALIQSLVGLILLGKASYVVFLEEPPDGVTLFSMEVGSNVLLLLLLGNTLVKGMPFFWEELSTRYPAPVQMSGVLSGINTHRVFSLFKCWVIIDLTPTLMLEKVGRGVFELTERVAVWELEKGLLLPIQGRKSKSPPSPSLLLFAR